MQVICYRKSFNLSFSHGLLIPCIFITGNSNHYPPRCEIPSSCTGIMGLYIPNGIFLGMYYFSLHLLSKPFGTLHITPSKCKTCQWSQLKTDLHLNQPTEEVVLHLLTITRKERIVYHQGGHFKPLAQVLAIETTALFNSNSWSTDCAYA